jgi:hypothetical protein
MEGEERRQEEIIQETRRKQRRRSKQIGGQGSRGEECRAIQTQTQK